MAQDFLGLRIAAPLVQELHHPTNDRSLTLAQRHRLPITLDRLIQVPFSFAQLGVQQGDRRPAGTEFRRFCQAFASQGDTSLVLGLGEPEPSGCFAVTPHGSLLAFDPPKLLESLLAGIGIASLEGKAKGQVTAIYIIGLELDFSVRQFPSERNILGTQASHDEAF